MRCGCWLLMRVRVPGTELIERGSFLGSCDFERLRGNCCEWSVRFQMKWRDEEFFRLLSETGIFFSFQLPEFI